MRRHVRRQRSGEVEERGLGGPARPSLPSASPAELATLLRLADAGARHQWIGELQIHHGNAGVAGLLGGDRPAHRDRGAHFRRGLASTLLADLVGDLGDWLGGGEQTEAEEGAPTPTVSGTTINVRDGAPIQVSGSLADVAATLAARDEAGSVTSHIADIYLEPTPGPVKMASITINETRVLPRWTDESKAPEADQKEWRRFMGAITAHEDRHVAIDQAGFAGLHKKALGVSEDVANERIDATDAAVTALNDAFDSDTDHGRGAGTRINPPLEEKGEKVLGP